MEVFGLEWLMIGLDWLVCLFVVDFYYEIVNVV